MALSAEFKRFIEGEKHYLREVPLSDVNENYYRWMNGPEVNQYLETRYFPQSMERIKEYVEMANTKSDQVFLAICLNHNGQQIGDIKLGPINWIHRFGEISLVIGEKEHWGKGYASEAIRLVSDYTFGILNLHKVTAGSYSTNLGSVRAFEKPGFELEGTWKKHYFSKGDYVDRVCFGKSRSTTMKEGR